MEQPIQIILGQAASEALTAAGVDCFMVIGKASHPEDPARWVIHLAPVTMRTAQDACEVLLGTKVAKKLPKPKAPDLIPIQG
jgi:hypothetical protein